MQVCKTKEICVELISCVHDKILILLIDDNNLIESDLYMIEKKLINSIVKWLIVNAEKAKKKK